MIASHLVATTADVFRCLLFGRNRAPDDFTAGRVRSLRAFMQISRDGRRE
jgi:hypothetical protein